MSGVKKKMDVTCGQVDRHDQSIVPDKLEYLYKRLHHCQGSVSTGELPRKLGRNVSQFFFLRLVEMEIISAYIFPYFVFNLSQVKHVNATA